MTRPPVALTIAGTDPSGGAGIHADLKSFAARGAYGTSVITALVAQNTHGVSRVYGLDEDFVAAQFDSVLGDMPVDAAKTGMLGTRGLVEMVVDSLARTPVPWLVVDPVMVATSGHRLLEADAVESVRRLLLPVAGLVTPNLPEAALLLGDDAAVARTPEQMRDQARELVARGAGAALVKGGHGEGDTVLDVLAFRDDGQIRIRDYTHRRVATRNTHGTGCTLSAAITAELARQVHDSHEFTTSPAGHTAPSSGNAAALNDATEADTTEAEVTNVEEAVFQGLEYLGRALRSAADWQLSLDMTNAHGPVDHLVDLAPVRAERGT